MHDKNQFKELTYKMLQNQEDRDGIENVVKETIMAKEFEEETVFKGHANYRVAQIVNEKVKTPTEELELE